MQVIKRGLGFALLGLWALAMLYTAGRGLVAFIGLGL